VHHRLHLIPFLKMQLNSPGAVLAESVAYAKVEGFPAVCHSTPSRRRCAASVRDKSSGVASVGIAGASRQAPSASTICMVMFDSGRPTSGTIRAIRRRSMAGRRPKATARCELSVKAGGVATPQCCDLRRA